MKRPSLFGSLGRPAVALLLGVASTAFAQGELKIYTAIEVEFETAPGKTYQLQGSSDLAAWSDVGEPFFGNGKTVNQIFSAKRVGAVSFETYRLAIADGPPEGHAPWTFVGLSFQMDDDTLPERLDFVTETNGNEVHGPSVDPFTYSLVKTGPDQVQTEILRDNGRRDVVTFSFSASGLGTFVREEFRGTRLKDRDLGSFRLVAGTPPPPPSGSTNAVPVNPPLALAGFNFIFRSGDIPEKLDFLNANAGIQYDDSAPSDFTYTYALHTDGTASLVVRFKADKWDEYDLKFTSGAQGTFFRREFKDGVLDDTDSGGFSPTDGAPGGNSGGTPGGGPAVAPTAVTGIFLQFHDGADVNRLEFQTASSGVDFDDSAPSPFTYTYTAGGESTASLVIRFKVDKWDEYDLTFTGELQGTYVRREFKDSVLEDTDSGRFARPTAP